MIIFQDQKTLSLNFILPCFFVSCFNEKFQKHLFADVPQNRVLKSFAKFTEKHLCWSLFLIKLQPSGLELFLNKPPAQVFSCEFCKKFKDTIFTEHLWTAASEIYGVSFLKESFFVTLDKSILANTIPIILFVWSAKILFCYYLCWIFSLLHFLKQLVFCSVYHLHHAFRKQ